MNFNFKKALEEIKNVKSYQESLDYEAEEFLRLLIEEINEMSILEIKHIDDLYFSMTFKETGHSYGCGSSGNWGIEVKCESYDDENYKHDIWPKLNTTDYEKISSLLQKIKSKLEAEGFKCEVVERNKDAIKCFKISI